MQEKFSMNNLLNILFTFLIAGCVFLAPINKVTIETPTIQCEMCKETIESNLIAIEGVKSVKVDMLNYQTVVKYNPARVSLIDLELAIAKSGYQANEIKADSMGYKNLPYCCRLPKDRKRKRVY